MPTPLMTKLLTKDNKKQEILDYFSTFDSIENDPYKLSEVEICKKFSGYQFSKRDIKDLLTELKSSGHLNSKHFKFEIFYTDSLKSALLSKWKDFVRPFDEILIALLIYLSLIVAVFFFQKENLGQAILYPVVLYIGYNVFHFSYEWINRKVSFFKSLDIKMALCLFIPTIIFIAIGFFGARILKNDFTITILLTLIALGITVGSFIYSNLFKKKEIPPTNNPTP